MLLQLVTPGYVLFTNDVSAALMKTRVTFPSAVTSTTDKVFIVLHTSPATAIQCASDGCIYKKDNGAGC